VARLLLPADGQSYGDLVQADEITAVEDIATGQLPELELIRRFVVVAEELSFTRAAARLGLAQPPLSAAIAKLERKLGVTLLERTSRRVTLTPAGAVLLEQGRIAIEAACAAVERTRRAGTEPARLTVAVKPGTGTDLLQQIILRCARDPQVPEVRLLFGHPGGPAAAVRAGTADVAILRAPFDKRALDTEPLRTEPRVAVLPAHHPLASRTELHRADLAGEPMPRWAGHPNPASAAHWTGHPDPANAARQPDPAPAAQRNGQPDPVAEPPPGPEINDISQLLDAVALGDAVAYVPVSLADQYRSAPGVVFLPVADLSPSETAVAWPVGSRSRAVAAFVRAAIEVAARRTEPTSALA
jgi:DNA-binding transcriptional LysR family regulator